MSVRRRAVCLLAAAGIIAIVAPAPAGEPARLIMAGACDNITDDQIDRLLKGLKAENAAREKAVAAANAKKADADTKKAAADADATRAATVMVNDMASTGECKDNFMEKDRRSNEVQRLYDLAAAASERGDDKKSETYSEQARKLEQALDIDADKACGGKGSSFLAACREEKAAKDPRSAEREQLQRQADDATKKGDTAAAERFSDQAKQLAAQIEAGTAMECIVKMTELRVGAGGVAAHAAGYAASQASNEAARMMREATASGSKEGAEAGGLTERQYGILKDCVIDRLNRRAPLPDGPAAAIDNRSGELKQALNP